MSNENRSNSIRIVLLLFIVTIVAFAFSQFMSRLTDFSPPVTALFNLFVAAIIVAVVYAIIRISKRSKNDN
ncbi:hypothetical protein CHH77_13600 [Shouchella clausii]|jgi:NADH:ubiquinone oxidoreductase subunit K|uniref:Uncharacterized protein n=1 Tax=Shouchella clausii TaxID=79880 RepID=A0A268NZ92_SHOCL|nr:hypothetical protein CHH73_14690 [Shouchella clausii]PAD46223.1 hypothetical protein CHI09_13010 [Shouchella clausii]PAE81343.1 hypothetical protein CHH77_13600 [Shouchella clausii]PAE88758.1 hypothetical protein CHH72_10285 [Shouchella clausii]